MVKNPDICTNCTTPWCNSCDNLTENKFTVLRSSTGLTRSQFSDMLHIPLRTLAAWETGDRTPPPYVYELIKLVVEGRL